MGSSSKYHPQLGALGDNSPLFVVGIGLERWGIRGVLHENPFGYDPTEVPMESRTDWKFPMRARVREVNTGVEGTVTGRCEYPGDMRQYQIVTGAGGVVRHEWVAEAQLEAVDTAAAG